MERGAFAWGEQTGALLSRGGEGIPRRRGASESFLELIEELGGEAPRLVQDGGLKRVEDIDAGVAADGDSKISGDCSPGSLPIGTVTGVDRRQRKHTEEIRGVQPGPAGGAIGSRNVLETA